MLGMQETYVLNKGGHGARNPMDGKTVTEVGTFFYSKRWLTSPLLRRLYDDCPAKGDHNGTSEVFLGHGRTGGNNPHGAGTWD